MVIAVVGSGGKTTMIHHLKEKYREEGKKVFVTTSTHMFIEEDTLLTDDSALLLSELEEKSYVMAGLPQGRKMTALSSQTYEIVSGFADVTLIEADGSKGLPLKYPAKSEPVIYENVDEIIVVSSLLAIGHPLEEVCHRYALLTRNLPYQKEDIVTSCMIEKIVEEGYMKRLRTEYPNKKISIKITENGSLYQRAAARMLQEEKDMTLLQEAWFAAKPCLFLCGGGHVSKALAEMAAFLNFTIVVMDDREAFANRERFPMADRIICDSFIHLKKYCIPGSYYVVLTRGHQDDFLCVKTVLQEDFAYLGMIGSKIKTAKTRERLKEEGFSQQQISDLHAPIGLSIGAQTPGEIAVSILAEIIQVKNKKAGTSLSDELIHTKESGTLCIIVDKSGSSPRGIGSMMLVTEEDCIDSIGGGILEAEIMQEARKCKNIQIKEYYLDNERSKQAGMICGGRIKILYIPI